jgi:hypothetical protein
VDERVEQCVPRRNQLTLKEYIMNEIHLIARLAQGLLAVTIVFAIGLVVQLSLVI